MARKTVRHKITSPELIEQINPDNQDLIDGFIEYLVSVGKSPTTIEAYKSDLNIAFVWCLTELNNKFFVEWTKRDVQKFQGYLIKHCELNSCRIRRLKACLSSMSNYIENILDDEFPNFRNIINKIESPPKVASREKTVFTEEEVKMLLDTLVSQKKYDRACLVALAAYGGRRKSELVRFKVSDFDDSHLICEGALYESDFIKTKGRGVNGKQLQCRTLANEFKPYFDMWMNYRKEQGIESEWLFYNKENPKEQMNVSTLNGWYDSFSCIVGKDFYLHSLRHFFCSALIRAGIPASVIKDMVGWESVEMVDIYSDISSSESFAKYFGAEGIKKVENKSLNDL